MKNKKKKEKAKNTSDYESELKLGRKRLRQPFSVSSQLFQNLKNHVENFKSRRKNHSTFEVLLVFSRVLKIS